MLTAAPVNPWNWMRSRSAPPSAESNSFSCASLMQDASPAQLQLPGYRRLVWWPDVADYHRPQASMEFSSCCRLQAFLGPRWSGHLGECGSRKPSVVISAEPSTASSGTASTNRSPVQSCSAVDAGDTAGSFSGSHSSSIPPTVGAALAALMAAVARPRLRVQGAAYVHAPAGHHDPSAHNMCSHHVDVDS